jgi:uncharacterized membrane protein YeaQ/YmgE (transglycosylase-associated protein family)
MENQKGSVKKIAMTYGLMLALLSIGLSVIVYVMDQHLDRPWWASLLSFLIMLAVLVYGLKAFKQENGGFLSLGEAIKTGLAISVIAGLVGAVFTYLFVTVIEPDFVNQMLDMTQEKMITDNPEMSQEQIDTAMSMTEGFMTPGIMATMGIIATLFFGFIISLIAGLVMKQNRPDNY